MRKVVVGACVTGVLLLLSLVAVPAMWEQVYVAGGGCVSDGGGGCINRRVVM